MKLNPTLLEVTLFVLSGVVLYVWLVYGKRLQRWWKDLYKRYRRPRQLRPREPEDCPLCHAPFVRLPRRAHPEVIPWSEIRSPRGRKKRIDTSGYACLNKDCHYFAVRDASVHALVSDGRRGQDKDILYLRCQACDKRFSSRLGTPLYHLRTPLRRIATVMTALSEGVDLAAAGRIFGHHASTFTRWLERGGAHSERLHERLLFRALEPGHVQLDELVTKVRMGEGKLWLWTAITAHSKLILAVHLGGRTIEDACVLIHRMSQRLVAGCLPVFTTDGLNQYFYGLTAHVGFWSKPPRARKYHWFPDPRLLYAQLRKARSGRSVHFLYSIMRLGERADLIDELLSQGLSGKVQTAYVERANLTLRELIAPLSRRTWSLAYDERHLWRHLQWGLAYYHLSRSHSSLRVRVRGPSKYRYRSPAMAAGVTRRRWSVADILQLPMPEDVWLQIPSA